MPHDTMSPEFSVHVGDTLSTSRETDSDILSAFKAAGNAILEPIKRAGAKAVLSAMMVAGAALGAPSVANAQAPQVSAVNGGIVSGGGLTLNSSANTPGAVPFGFASNGTAVAFFEVVGPSGGTVPVTITASASIVNPNSQNSGYVWADAWANFPYPETNFVGEAFELTGCFGCSGSLIQGGTSSASQPFYVSAPYQLSPNVQYFIAVESFASTLYSGGGSATANVTISPSLPQGYTLVTSPATLTPQVLAGKALGDASNIPCACDPETGKPVTERGDPITLSTGNVFESATDYKTAGQNPLEFTRYYNSLGYMSGNGTFASTLGMNWRSNYDRYLNIISPTAVNAERPDGQVLNFALNGSVWTTDSDVDVTLTQSGSTWTLTDRNDNVETYAASNNEGVLQSIVARNGYTQNLVYSSGLLHTVTDSYQRKLTFGYANGLLSTLTTPDNLTYSYGFMSSGGRKVLSTVTYSTSPATNITYQYTDASFPFALTGTLDEKGQQYQSWGYDTQGRGTSNQRGGALGADSVTLTYNADGSTTVTNAFGVADTYKFSTLQGVPKVTEIDRAATSTTAAATRTFGYDSNGFLSSETDWSGNQTTYVNNAQGNPTTINYAVGSPVAYSITIQYDPTFIRLPQIITAPGVTSTYVRDGSGNPLNRTDLDTTTNTIPYSTNGQTRETQWTWSTTGEELSVQLPRTDKVAKTQFGYDTTGALTSVTDALNHMTQITAHTGGGLPQTIIDPNNVTTTLAYTSNDGKLRLNTSTLQTGAGNLTTTWTWNPEGTLQSLQQPDGSKLAYGYDAAHRLTSVTDLFGNATTYTLDALGGATLTNVTNPSSTVTRTSSAVFDALDRMTSSIGGMGQTTGFTFDNMGNTLTITPPAPSGAITQTVDALNRLSTRTDPAPGGTTTIIYDPFNRVTNVQDANGNSTSSVYDGFGDRTQTVSPDSGSTVFHWDPDKNLTQRVQPGSLTMNATFDALDRNLTVKYTGDATLNVTNTWDQPTGHGFGIGRLTSAVDQVGTLSLTYDERGNTTNELRTPTGLSALNTSTTYDAASNVSSITYPSGNVVTNIRDSMGKVTSVTSKPSGASSATTIANNVAYEPLPEFAAAGAPPITGLNFGNGVTGTYHYDLDYRATTRVDSGTVTVQNLAYGYFANNSVQTITDAVNAANTQNMTYDTLDRLKTAASGAGGYGSYSFTWDPVSNIKTEIVNGTTTTFNYTAHTNRLLNFKTGTTTETETTSASGNITAFKIGTTAVETLTYNKANELATAATAAQSASYAFDEFGKRLKEVGTATGTSTFQYGRDGNVLTDTDGAGNSRVDYIYLNGQPIGTYQVSNNKFYFISTDRFGTPSAVTDTTQANVWSATYQPFGNTGTGASGIVQNLRLPGQEWDLESTFNHNGFRDYAATLTRYIETDPIGLAGGMNTYQYANGNPFKYTDPKGTDAVWWEIVRLVTNKTVIDPASDKADKALAQSWLQNFWSNYGIPLVGDKDYSPNVKGALGCAANAFGGPESCLEGYAQGANEEMDRKLAEARDLWQKRHANGACPSQTTPKP